MQFEIPAADIAMPVPTDGNENPEGGVKETHGQTDRGEGGKLAPPIIRSAKTLGFLQFLSLERTCLLLPKSAAALPC